MGVPERRLHSMIAHVLPQNRPGEALGDLS